MNTSRKRDLDELPTAPFTLLKYHIPQLVTERKVELRSGINSAPVGRLPARRLSEAHEVMHKDSSCVQTKYEKNMKPVTSAAQRPYGIKTSPREAETHFSRETNSEEICIQDSLDALFSPREFRLKSGAVYIQHVSADPATRLDVLALSDQLNKELEKQRAKECGICPIREALYSDCFNELIRQVTVGCAERGHLLHKVKKELDDTKKAYATLYSSVTRFALRKTLKEEKKEAEESATIKELEADIERIQEEETELQNKYEEMLKEVEIIKTRVRNLSSFSNFSDKLPSFASEFSGKRGT